MLYPSTTRVASMTFVGVKGALDMAGGLLAFLIPVSLLAPPELRRRKTWVGDIWFT